MPAVIYVHFDEKICDDQLVEAGWQESNAHGKRARLKIGNNPAEALNRLRGVFDIGGFKFRGIFGEDIQVISNGKMAIGDFAFKSIRVILRAGSASNARYLNFSGSFNDFEEFLELLVRPDFSTDWLEHTDWRPVTEGEALKRPTLAQRLATRRSMPARKR